MDRPSYRLKPGDFVQIAEQSRDKAPFQVAASGAHADAAGLPRGPARRAGARVERTPNREEVPVICDEQLVVEYYSR